MARKDLLKSLMGPPADNSDGAGRGNGTGEDPPAPPRPRHVTKGAIGAVNRSIADLRARSIVEIDPFEIEAGGLKDRLEHDEESHAGLMESLREYGQQVPVLVRPHPEKEGRFQIVYGRRRVLALRDLGQPVKALVRDLDDRSLVVAQGQENTARRDLSFIEKANFTRQMAEAGYDRKIICDALSIDKTVISRMLSITERLPIALIEEIGSAPGIGRDRWLQAADLWEREQPDPEDARAIVSLSDGRSDKRFEALLGWLTRRGKARPKARTPRPKVVVQTEEGGRLAELSRGRGTLTLTLRARDELDGFDEWLAENLTEIHRDWRRRRDG